MGKVNYIKLGDACKFINGDRGINYPKVDEFVQQGIPFINTGHIEKNKIIFSDMNYITQEKYSALSSGKVSKGDVVYCLRGSLGKHAIVEIDLGAIASSLVILKPNHNLVISKYLLYVLDSKDIEIQQLKANNGSSQPNLSASSVKEFIIPLPNMDIQKKIVTILDKAQSLIDKRKEQIEACDELVKSLFYEMFGDPVKNDKGWKISRLDELGRLERGKSKHRPRNAPELLNGPYPLIQTGDVSNAGLYITNYTSTYSEVGLKQSKMWPSGTLCITIAANIAKTAILTFDACFPDSVVGFTENESSNKMFIQIWMTFLQQMLEETAPESAQKNINLKILNELSVITPPLSLQNKFAAQVEKIEQQKKLLEQSFKELENNFNSLMQRAFKGELF